MPHPVTNTPISLSAFADRYGVTVGAVTNWRSRLQGFPSPIDPTAKRALYDLDELLAWCRTHSRVPTSRCDAALSPLFFVALPEKGSKAPAMDAADALAIVAVVTLRCISPTEVDAPDALLTPGLELLATCDQAVVEVLQREVQQRAKVSVAALVDELRTDYAALADEYGWAERTAVADVVAALAEPARSVIDPCCGNGSLLAAVARGAHLEVRLTGIEYDAVRAASAYALLRCEGLDVRIEVGDTFEKMDVLDQHDLLVASPPVGAGQQKTPNDMDEWVDLCTNKAWAQGVQQSLVLVPTSWVLHPQPTPGGNGHDLILNPLLAAAVTLSPGRTQRRQSVTVLGFGRIGHEHDRVLIVDASGASDSEALERVRKLSKQLGSYGYKKKEKSLGRGARLLSLGELEALGTVAPDSYTRSDRPRVHASGRSAMSDLPELAFRDLRASLAGGWRTAPRRVSDDTPTLGTLVKDGLIDVGDPSDLDDDQAPVVTIGTTSANFGQVAVVRPGSQPRAVARRGLVGLRVLPGGEATGLIPEFLAAWLASAHVQSVIDSLVGTGKVRRSLSRGDVLSLPADFPDRRRQEHAATRWEEFEELTEFHQQLRRALDIWKLRLLEDPDAPQPTEG